MLERYSVREGLKTSSSFMLFYSTSAIRLHHIIVVSATCYSYLDVFKVLFLHLFLCLMKPVCHDIIAYLD